MIKQNELIEWPYPIRYGDEKEYSTDVLVLGGGTSGCFAAIAAAGKGASVAIVEKAATIRSGAGGAGVDHWGCAADNPASKVAPEVLFKKLVSTRGGYSNGITDYILCRTNYETLFEIEAMGGKVRDVDDEFKGAEFRDKETKLLFAHDYENRIDLRVWGATFKDALVKEIKRLGIKIHDRIMSTCLLTEGGRPGARVIGAAGINTRTGEFNIFKAKATVLCLGFPGRNWSFSTELRGISQVTPPHNVGNGHAMAWRAGAEFTMMEKTIRGTFNSPYAFPSFGVGNHLNTWYPCTMVDANGKEIPWVDRDGRVLKSVSDRSRPASGQDFILTGTYQKDYEHKSPELIPDLKERVERGEYTLPLYADLPCMPKHERKAIWGLMVGNEGKTNIPILKTYTDAGFDPDKDMLQSYYMMRGNYMTEPGFPQDRLIFFWGGGVVVDWDLKTSLDGLYAAGEQVFGSHSYPGAATSGRWAGRMAAAYAIKTADRPPVHREQIDGEMSRIYAPVARDRGMDWKELNAGLARIMQNYCGEPQNDELLKIGRLSLKEMEDEEASDLYADNPHKLMRALDILDIITCNMIIMHSCLARKASSEWLNLKRTDYPRIDPEDWRKFITLKLEGGEVKVGELPFDFWEPVKDNFEARYGAGF